MHPLEKLSNRGWYKINIWKTEGMLELSSWSEHTAAAMENLLPSLQNAFSHPLPWHTALAAVPAALPAPLELLPALQGPQGDVAGQCPRSECAGFYMAGAGQLCCGHLSAAQWQEVPPFITRPESSAFAVCGGSILSWVLCKDFQINRCWLCQWEPLFYLMAESQLEH